MQAKFVIDPSLKEDVMKGVGLQFRNFRSLLTRTYIHCDEPSNEELVNEDVDDRRPPWQKYDGITEDQWREFVEKRRTPEFLVSFQKKYKLSFSNITCIICHFKC